MSAVKVTEWAKIVTKSVAEIDFTTVMFLTFFCFRE